MKKNIAVIGLGRFGVNLCESLSKMKVDVIALDVDEKRVRKASQFIKNSFVCDCTSESALKELGLQNVEHAIIAFGQNESDTLVNTIVTTILLNSLGVKEITVRLDDEIYENALRKIGATNIINPMKVASDRVAIKVAATNFVDYFKINDEYNVIELMAPKNMTEISLIDLNAPKKFGANIVLIKRDEQLVTPKASDIIMPNDEIYIFGKEEAAKKLIAYLKTR